MPSPWPSGVRSAAERKWIPNSLRFQSARKIKFRKFAQGSPTGLGNQGSEHGQTQQAAGRAATEGPPQGPRLPRLHPSRGGGSGPVGVGRSPCGQPGSSPGPGSRPWLSGTLNAALAGPAAGGGHWWPLMGPACVVTRTGALPSFGGLSRATSHSCRVPCPRGSSRWVDRRGWGACSGDTHVRGVPRPTSGGNDDVLGRKQSLGRNRGSLGHLGTHGRPQAPRKGSTVSSHSHCLWRRPRSSPETGLSTGRRASQLTQRPQGEVLQNPTRPCRAGPPEPRAAWCARLLRHRGLGHPGPPGDVVSTPAALIAGDSAEAARTWDLPTLAQTGPWEPRRQVLTSSPPLETPQTVCVSTKLALTFKYLTFLQNKNRMLKCDLRPPMAQG